MTRRRIAVAAVLGAAAALGAGAAAGADAPAVPTLSWTACPPPAAGGASVKGFVCATAVVPMDHADPGGRTFRLAVIRHPADDPAARIGTLFWNPGGPSDAGTQYLPASIQGFPAEVRRRFDIVSWDPRGMGGRTRPVVQCFANQAQEARFLALNATGPDIPVSRPELTRFLGWVSRFNRECVRRNGDLLAHVSTADNARDLDLLRQAVGDERTTYYGTSYGTFLGATYLNMFPDRVRAAVLDGAVSPVAWAGDGPGARRLSTFIRVGSDQGSAATVAEFMRRCGAAGRAGCAFSAGSPAATLRKWSTLLRRTRARPATLGGQALSDRSVIAYVQSSIYLTRPLPGFGRFPGWAAVGAFLQQAWTASATPAAPGDTSPGTEPPPPASSRPSAYTTSAGRQLSVICGESPNPGTVAGEIAQARASYARAGLNSWPFVARCLGWGARAASPYLGPWNVPSRPVLVIGNTFDPATPYDSSRRMAGELADGHLLTVDGYGHTELLNPSACAEAAVTAYLIDGTLPPDGTRCAQDGSPFGR